MASRLFGAVINTAHVLDLGRLGHGSQGYACHRCAGAAFYHEGVIRKAWGEGDPIIAFSGFNPDDYPGSAMIGINSSRISEMPVVMKTGFGEIAFVADASDEILERIEGILQESQSLLEAIRICHTRIAKTDPFVLVVLCKEAIYATRNSRRKKLTVGSINYAADAIISGASATSGHYCSSQSGVLGPGSVFKFSVEPGDWVIVTKEGCQKGSVTPDIDDYSCWCDASFMMVQGNWVDGRLVQDIRRDLGVECAIATAKKYPEILADPRSVLIPIPDGGNYYAVGFAEHMGWQSHLQDSNKMVKYVSDGIVKNKYPRDVWVDPYYVYNPKRVCVEDRIVILIDDGVRHGYNIKAVIRRLREYGALGIYAIFASAQRCACMHGNGGEDLQNLPFAAGFAHEDEMARALGIDGMVILDNEDRLKAINTPGRRHCFDCCWQSAV